MNEVEPAIPTYYVRYEDLILNCQETLEQLFCFLLEVESIAGTVIEKRIRDQLSPDPPRGVCLDLTKECSGGRYRRISKINLLAEVSPSCHTPDWEDFLLPYMKSCTMSLIEC